MKLSDILLVFIWSSWCMEYQYSGWMLYGPLIIYLAWRYIEGFIEGWKHAKAKDANRS